MFDLLMLILSCICPKSLVAFVTFELFVLCMNLAFMDYKILFPCECSCKYCRRMDVLRSALPYVLVMRLD